MVTGQALILDFGFLLLAFSCDLGHNQNVFGRPLVTEDH